MRWWVVLISGKRVLPRIIIIITENKVTYGRFFVRFFLLQSCSPKMNLKAILSILRQFLHIITYAFTEIRIVMKKALKEFEE